MKQLSRVGLFSLILFGGCASAPVCKTFSYSWGMIEQCTPNVADAVCAKLGTTRWDNGALIQFDEHVAGCTTRGPKACAIVVRDDEEGAEALPHELAHCDGKADPGADYAW